MVDGTGLGLSITKSYVEMLGGQIWVESPGFDEEACPGSTFHLEIPMLLEDLVGEAA